MTTPLKRATGIASILSEEGLGFVAARLGFAPDKGDGELTPEQRAQLPARVRRLCERLGPMFVKFGQVLSMRKDLLPEDYCVELAKLQSTAAPFDVRLGREMIETRLDGQSKEIFARIDDLPLASASLAQVYGAELCDGSRVVVKVQRPDAHELVNADLELLLFLSRQLHRIVPQYRTNGLHRFAEEFARGTRRELDFLNEAAAASRFHENHKDDAHVKIPRVYEEWSSSSLIVMERLDGVRLDRIPDSDAIVAMGLSPKMLVQNMLRIVFDQALLHGIVHADLHPGNVFVLPDGRIGLIDFGMYGELSRDLQTRLLRTMMHRAERRHEDCAAAMVEVYKPNPGADVDGFRRALVAMLKRVEDSALEDYSIGAMFAEEGEISRKFGFVAPDGLIIFGRALLVAEGLALRFDPTISLPDELKPIMQRIMMRRFDMKHLLDTLSGLMPDLMQHLENAPKMLRQYMSIERRFANAEPGQALGDVLGLSQSPAPSRAGSFGPWFASCVLWSAAAAAALIAPPAGTPLVSGIPWFALVSSVAATAVTLVALIKRP